MTDQENVEQPTADPVEIHLLKEDALRLWPKYDRNKVAREIVPPQTPNSDYGFSYTFKSVPTPFPNLDNLEVPSVREYGIKFAIDSLSEFFGCNDYKANMLQFWFLDMITDCIWMAQDDFNLPVDQQKIVLQWLLHIVDLLRDPQRNLSRKQFFSIFKEAMLIAAEVVDEGCDTVPAPQKLCALIDEEDECESWSSDSSSVPSSLEVNTADYEGIACLQWEIDEKRQKYQLPDQIFNSSKFDLSSVDTLPATSTHTETDEEHVLLEESNIDETGEDVSFYQPYPEIPSRFLPLLEEEKETVLPEYEGEGGDGDKIIGQVATGDIISDEYEMDGEDVYEVADQFIRKQTSDMSTNTIRSESIIPTMDPYKDNSGNPEETEIKETPQLPEDLKAKLILKSLALEKLWDQRLQDMDDPKKGWIPTRDEIGEDPKEAADEEVKGAEEEDSEKADASDDEEWAEVIIKKHKKRIQEEEDKLVMNYGVLRAIISFVFKYFYESFQFILIKLAFQATPDIISQKINSEWKIPKKIKQEVVKPKVEKPKKPKQDKKKKPPKEKAQKKGKKDKTDSKKEKKKDLSKASKKKPAKPTKEEKEELERQKKEKARLEEELRIMEENKKLMFPLDDAATDELFNNLFENWVRKKDKSKSEKGKKKK